MLRESQRSSDNVEVMNPELYKICCDAFECLHYKKTENIVADAVKKIKTMRTCANAWHESKFDINGEAHAAIDFLCTRSLKSSEQPSIENLKSISAQITKRFGGTMDCLSIHLMSKSGYVIWLVQDFLKGPNESAWFKGESYKDYGDAYYLAILKLMNFKIPEVDPTKYRLLSSVDLFFLRKAIIHALEIKRSFSTTKIGGKCDAGYEAICTLTSDAECNYYSRSNSSFSGEAKIGHIAKNKESKDQAIERAQNIAETRFFKKIFDIDGPEEFTVDELGRPVYQN